MKYLGFGITISDEEYNNIHLGIKMHENLWPEIEAKAQTMSVKELRKTIGKVRSVRGYWIKSDLIHIFKAWHWHHCIDEATGRNNII